VSALGRLKIVDESIALEMAKQSLRDRDTATPADTAPVADAAVPREPFNYQRVQSSTIAGGCLISAVDPTLIPAVVVTLLVQQEQNRIVAEQQQLILLTRQR